MKERLKKLRKMLGLTQREFGERIGVKPNTIATYEIGRNEPIDAVVSLICREFNVNEVWLRTGKEPMFAEISEDEELTQIFSAIAVSDDALIKRIIRAYWKLNDNEKEIVRKLIDGFSVNVNSNTKIEKIASPAVVKEVEMPAPSMTDKMPDVMSKLAEVEQQNKELLNRLEVLEKEDEWEKEQMEQSISPTRPHSR
ncbi:XRE family transcriptional regulator [bacterium 1XD42-1]|nr:XRE family transcriptional regulator [bacterium 1XD42-8]RKJ62203.1 XRE family transcriptional regulator [bacterium 1XD42-1]